MAFATEHARREVELEQAAEALRTERDEAIRQAHKDDLPMSDIADILSLTHQRVSQIVRS